MQEKSEPNKTEMRWAILGTFTLNHLPPLLTTALGNAGFNCATYLGGFNQISQEVLDPASGLYKFGPDSILLVTDIKDFFPDAYEGAKQDLDGQAQTSDLEITRFQQLIDRLLDQMPEATIYIATPSLDDLPNPHILDPNSPERGQSMIEQFSARFRRIGRESRRVIIVDWDWHVRSRNTGSYRDDRLWYMARMRLNPQGLASLANLVADYVCAHRGRTRKVAIVDLDNTLWGGTIGEDGLSGLKIGQEGVGLAFTDIQKEFSRLHDSGILLAICSKNNPEDGWQAIDEHPSMVLRRDSFASAQINWDDKVKNLKRISSDLNLGLDSFVFFDDNPVERAWVSSQLPEVLVPELPQDPTVWPNFLRNLTAFRRLQVTAEDVARPGMYQAQTRRNEAESSAPSLDSFLETLGQEAEILPLSQIQLERAVQMCQRTNQFNLTSPRYISADIERMIEDPQIDVYTLALRDRFGDNGITGLTILRQEDDRFWIDTLLLSCRVIGRQVEDALVAFIANRARSRGAEVLVGQYIPTNKNSMVEHFYSRLGFLPTEQSGNYELDLKSTFPKFPSCIKIAA